MGTETADARPLLKGTHLPDYRTALLMVQEAGIAANAAFVMQADAESKRKKAGNACAVPANANGVGNTATSSTNPNWSGREDSNLRLLRPERSTLPG